MSVRQSMLALLAQGPRHGARIKAEFEATTGGPLNVGQVYTTLARLERDGLVVGDGRPDDEGRIAYHLTEAGRARVQRWWTEPVDRDDPGRDELLIKLALALADPEVDALAVVQAQRTATMRVLQQLTRRKIALDTPGPGRPAPGRGHPDAEGPWGGLAERLVLEHRLFAVEAELRWLDQTEALLIRGPASASAAPPSPAPTTGANR